LVIEDGGGEDQAIAAMLHDAVEDGGGRAMLERIVRSFGGRVAEIVEGCSDSVDLNPERTAHKRARNPPTAAMDAPCGVSPRQAKESDHPQPATAQA
jgi:(p)ppGpp synthase/HD superfamily hydrolase